MNNPVNRKSFGTVFSIVFVIFMFCIKSAFSLPPTGHISDRAALKSGETMLTSLRTMININNIQMFCDNIGVFAQDISVCLETATGAGLYYPAGTFKTAVYSGGIWIGGTVNDQIRLAIGAYNNPEYFPGPADENGQAMEDNVTYKVYKINSDPNFWDDPTGGIKMADGTPYMRFDSTKHIDDYADWPIEQGAPLDDSGQPLILGDQTLWTVFNDGGPHEYATYGGGTDPLGVEIQATFWGYNLGGVLGRVIYMKYMLINKSPDTIDSCYVTLWSDPDLGGGTDDLVGCDSLISLGYCYNATNNDNVYGTTPPAVGYAILQGPIIKEGDPLYNAHDFSTDTVFYEGGEFLPDAFVLKMESFIALFGGTDPDTPEEAYGYMRGNDSKGSSGGDPNTPPTNPQTSLQINYYYPGDPVAGTGWLDYLPSDKRLMCNSGPFTFNPDDTQLVVAALVIGQGNDRLSSVTLLKEAATTMQINDNYLKVPTSRPIIELSSVEGLNEDGKALTGESISFYIRMLNNSINHECVDNCFKIYSPDGATWGATSAEIVSPEIVSYMDADLGIDEYDTDGSGTDKIGFSGSSSGSGIPVGFDMTTYKITIGPFDTESGEKSIVLDSCSANWTWCNGIIPLWRGPYQFDIVSATDIDDNNEGILPDNFVLRQNYPNPFNPSTKIEYELLRKSSVSIVIYNNLGRKVRTFSNGIPKDAGRHSIYWDGKTDDGNNVATGLYFYSLTIDGKSATKKMILLK